MPIKESLENKDIALIDILDVILDKGVAIKGDLIISIAGVDLVYLDLRVLIASVEKLVSSKNERSDLSSIQFDKQREELSDAACKEQPWKNQSGS
ncbi:gas vesicle protein [Falsibacillus pallidus]|uniref:Gas vesicle protein GvpA/GvpJ/GvpM family n=1 Tax=Falsibacillus pallidus TaxID=493781 RepID=A0A370GR41_9BACI|nr:gas vesicle protein [Falsibacillus pallidus]RDI45971.1 gas vesicle protein GvpA/GvpJ/GvpM family [Falsibacillus pallidus]